MKRLGFTLVEIMIVVAIIGLLSAIAIPNFTKVRDNALKAACIKNLKNIQTSVQMWALDTSAATDAVPATGDLVPAYIRRWPQCCGVNYAVPSVSATPVCPNGKEGHVIDSSGGGGGGSSGHSISP